MTAEQAALVSRIARRTAKAYARRYPWVSEDDLEQEVWAYVLPSIAELDASRPEAPAYIHAKAVTACKRAAWRMGAVANVPRSDAAKGEVTRQRNAALDEQVVIDLADQAATADAAIEQAEERLALAKLVAEYLANDDEGAAIRAVLTGDMKSKQAAEIHGVDLSRLYWRTQQAKRAMQDDPRFQEFV